MAELNDQYLNSLRVALFQFTRESSNFTSVLSEVFDNLNTSSSQSSRQIDNSTKSVKGFGDAISSSSTYLKDFKSYVSNNSKNIAESSKAVKEYTSQLSELKQKSVDINRNWGALNSALRNNIAASESSTRQHELNKAILSKEYAEADQRFKDARNISGALASDTLALGEAAGKLKKQLDDLTNLQIGKIDLNAQIKTQNQELYKNIYDTFGNSLLTIDSLINEKTSSWKGLKGSIDELARDAFKDTSLNISKEFQKNGIPGLHDYNKALAEALLSLERTGGVIDESNFLIIDKFQQFAEKVGDSSEYVKNINTALNAHVKSIVDGKTPEEAKTSISGDIVDKLTESYQGNIEALDKFSKSINKTFTKHQIAFSTIIDKQLSEQSNIFGKFIYNFGKGAVQGGAGGTEGMTNALNQFTGSLREGILPALKSIALGSKDYITSEAQALFNGIKLDRVSSQKLQEGDSAALKKLGDSKAIWQNMSGGIDDFTKQQLDTSKTFRDVIGVDAEMRTKEFVELMKTQQSLGVLDTSGKGGAENEKKLKDILNEAKKISDAGIYSQTQTLEIFNNTVRSAEFLKVSAGMDKKRRTAQEMEVMTTIKFASALNMSTEAAKAFAIASASAGANLSPQQMISNVATTLKTQNILDYYAKELGVKSEISDIDRSKMTEIENKPAQMRTDQEKEFFNEFLLKMVKQNQDEQARLTELSKEAEARGDKAAVQQYSAMSVQLANQFDTSIAEYSGGEKDIIAAYVKQYPTMDMAKIEKDRKEGETLTQAIVRQMDKKSEEKTTEKDTLYNDTIINLSSLAAQWKAFTENIVGSNILALGTAALGILSVVADLGVLAKMFGGAAAVAEGGAAVAAAGTAAGVAGTAGMGAAAVALLPELLAALGIAGGVALFAYGAKGLYDSFFGEGDKKEDRGDAIHGIVDVNNLDIYTNQTTDAIDTQTQELLKGFTSIMGNPDDVKNAINNNSVITVNNLDVYTNQTTDAINNQTLDLLKGFTSIMGNPDDVKNAINNNNSVITVNNLDVYTNQTTDAINNQTLDLLKGFTSIMGNPDDVKKAIDDNTAAVKENTTISTDTASGTDKKIETLTSSFAATLVAGIPVHADKPLTDYQVKMTELYMQMGNKLSPVVQSAYDLAKNMKNNATVSDDTKQSATIPDVMKTVEDSKKIQEQSTIIKEGNISIVDVNNLDMYTNQVTNSIDNQTLALLAGFTTIMGNPIDIQSNTDTTKEQSTSFSLNETAQSILSFLSELKDFAGMVGIGGAAAAEGGVAAVGAAGVGAAGVGAAATAVLPEILAALGIAGGVALFAYGAKGIYDYFTGDGQTEADKGDAIHGMVDVNNLDMYTNQVTDSIDIQTQELLKGFTTLMGNPTKINDIDATTSLIDKLGTPISTDTSIPLEGSKLTNPNNGNTNIEQPTGPLPSEKINNTDISVALEDLKTFLTNELIVGMLSKFDALITNTGNTAKNTGDDGTLGDLVATLTKPASQPYVRGTVENAATLTG